MFLIKSINNRKNTLYKVLEIIVEKQKDYFELGKKYLKPMTMKEVSELINVHESTVSRAINGKYIFTKYGTVKIKDLFINIVFKNESKSEEISVEAIKNLIEDLIQDEDKKKPLSDQKISEKINEKNLNISRRTVAKYREEIGIKSSSKRKRL